MGFVLGTLLIIILGVIVWLLVSASKKILANQRAVNAEPDVEDNSSTNTPSV